MANKPIAQHVLKYKGAGNVQVFTLLAGVNTGAQDGSDVGTGTPSGLAIVETAPNAGTFAHNRNIEFLNDHYALVGCNAVSVSGVFKKNSGGGTGQWGQVQYNNLGRPFADGMVSGLHVLHPAGAPILCYMLFETGSDLHFYFTADGTTGASWAAADGTVELNGAVPSSVGQSIIFQNSIFWAHQSFTGGAGTGAITEYNLKTSTLTRHNTSVVLHAGSLACSYALHVHDSVLFAFSWDGGAEDALVKLQAGIFVNVSSKTGQVAAPATNPAGTTGHPVMFTDHITGDLIIIMTGRRFSNDSPRAKVNRVENATGSPVVSDISTTVMGAIEGADRYLEGGSSANFNRRWSVFVDTVTDPTAPRTYLTTWVPGGSTETWEWISSVTGGYGEMELVGAGAGIPDDHALPYNSVGGGHRTPRTAVVEIVDTPEEILAGTRVSFRGYGDDSTATAPSGTLTFYGADDQGTPSTVIPIVPGSLSVGAGLLTDLEAYYKFEGAGGGDSSGNGLDLNKTGTVTVGTGLFGDGADFPGTNGNFMSRAGDDPALDVGQALAPFAFSVWVDADVLSGSVFTKGNDSTNGYYLNIAGGGEVNWLQHPSSQNIFSAPGDLNVGAGLQHIVVTSDGVTTKIYVDGIEKASAASVAVVNSTSGLMVGNRQATNAAFNGVIDELAIWSRHLTLLEIEALYNANSSGGAGKELDEVTALPIIPNISGNTIVDFTADNGSTLYSVTLDVGTPGVDIEEGDIGIIIADLI